MARPKPQILKSLKNNIPPGSKLLVAVSGGKDSISLLHGLVQLREKLKLTLEVAHIDHGIREVSGNDAKFVKKIAETTFNLKFHLLKVKPPNESSENLESWGRKVRYDFFGKILKKRKLDWIVTAHNANDQIETFFIKLISNKEILPILKVDNERRVVRPIIDIPRNVIEKYIIDNKLGFCEDETNADVKFLRNKIRIKLIPFLSENFGIRVCESLADRISEIYQDNFDLSESKELKYHYFEIIKYKFGEKDWIKMVKQSLSILQSQESSQSELSLQWRLLQKLFKQELGYGLGRDKCRELVKFFKTNSAEVLLPNNKKFVRKEGKMVIVDTVDMERRAPARLLEVP